MTKDDVERFNVTENRNGLGFSNGVEASAGGYYVRHSDYVALLARAEAAEAERDRQYDENVHRIMMEAAAHAKGREEGLREAADVAETWWRNSGKGNPQDEIRALIEKPEGE